MLIISSLAVLLNTSILLSNLKRFNTHARSVSEKALTLYIILLKQAHKHLIHRTTPLPTSSVGPVSTRRRTTTTSFQNPGTRKVSGFKSPPFYQGTGQGHRSPYRDQYSGFGTFFEAKPSPAQPSPPLLAS